MSIRETVRSLDIAARSIVETQAIAGTVARDPQAGWVFVVDNLTIHCSATLVRYVAQECGIEEDLGQKGNPLPPDGLAAFIDALRARGMSAAQIDVMARRNPARLLELQ